MTQFITAEAFFVFLIRLRFTISTYMSSFVTFIAFSLRCFKCTGLSFTIPLLWSSANRRAIRLSRFLSPCLQTPRLWQSDWSSQEEKQESWISTCIIHVSPRDFNLYAKFSNLLTCVATSELLSICSSKILVVIALQLFSVSWKLIPTSSTSDMQFYSSLYAAMVSYR